MCQYFSGHTVKQPFAAIRSLRLAYRQTLTLVKDLNSMCHGSNIPSSVN